MSNKIQLNSGAIHQWLIEKLQEQEIEGKLISLGHNDESILAHLKEYKRIKYAKRQNAGFVYVAIGAILGFISCVITMINPLPDWNDIFLYGLTSIAIVIVFIGFYLIFE